MYTLAVSYLEWIRWIATGWYRCADRVVWVEGPEDQQGIDALMDRAPDLQVSDDQGYVIARLKPDALISSRRSFSERSIGHLWISVAGVSSFNPLSVRGARLLEADAERAAVRLGEPLFEKLWVDWRDRRLEDEAHWRGHSLCLAFGIPLPELSRLASATRDILSGVAEAPNAAKLREHSFEGTRAFGWAAAMSVAVMDPGARSAVEQSMHHGEVKSRLKVLMTNFEIRRPLLDDSHMTRLSTEIDKLLPGGVNDSIPVAVMATVFHYRNLALGGREVSLDALLADLTDIALDDPHHASLSAYFIGRSMENVAVTTLLYQSAPARYAALAPARGQQQLDVMVRAAARSESNPHVDQTHLTKSNPSITDVVGNLRGRFDPAFATTEPESDEQAVGDQLQVEPATDARDDNDANVAISNLAPPGDLKVETPRDESIEISTSPHGGMAADPSERGAVSLDQTDRFGSEIKADLFEQTVGNVEPIAPSAKSRKNRKKSDKTSEVKSDAETFDDKSDR